MRPNEAAAQRWIARTIGCPMEQVRFQPCKNPDFVTPDGRGWEVKTLQVDGTLKYVSIPITQWYELEQWPTDCVLLVYALGEEDPRYVAPFSLLPLGSREYNGLRVYALSY